MPSRKTIHVAKSLHALKQEARYSKNIANNELLRLIHAAILNKISDEDEEAVGKVTVSFTLYPDGHMKNILLLNSSGSNQLDEMVLVAMGNVVIGSAESYIHSAKLFQIDINFEV